jgi:hypothetical protein
MARVVFGMQRLGETSGQLLGARLRHHPSRDLRGEHVAELGEPLQGSSRTAATAARIGGALTCYRQDVDGVWLPSSARLKRCPPPLTAADPLAWGLAGFGCTGMLLYAHALEHGPVGPVTALLWIVEVIAPSAIGIVLLGDTVRTDWTPAAATAVIATLAAAAVLANAPAHAATAQAAGRWPYARDP